MFAGRRKPVIMLFMFFSVPCSLAILLVEFGEQVAAQSLWNALISSQTLLLGLYFFFGFFSFVPHMMIGLYSRELFPDLPSTAASLTKLIAQIGAGFAGL
jgi:sugar phosphate permease